MPGLVAVTERWRCREGEALLAAASLVLSVVHVVELLEARWLLLGVRTLLDEGLVWLLRWLLAPLSPVLPILLHILPHSRHLFPE